MNRNLLAVILLGLAIGLYFTYTAKLVDDIKATSAINDGYTSALSSAKELIRLREQVNQDWLKIDQTDQDRLSKMIPNTVDNIRLVIDLNSIAVKNGFSLKNIRASASADAKKDSVAISPPTKGGSTISTPTLDTVTVSFSATAPYAQFLNFLQDLESSLRIMDVTHITLSGSDTGTYDFGVELKTYWLRQ